MATHDITASTITELPLDEVWAKLSDLGKAHFYVPDITGTQITTEQKTGVGTSRIVTGNRAPLIETVTVWNERAGFTLRLHHDKGDGVPPLFKHATFEYAIKSETESTTRLTNTMCITPKGGVLGDLFAKLIRKPMLTMQNQITYGQRLFYESGERPSKAAVRALMAEEGVA